MEDQEMENEAALKSAGESYGSMSVVLGQDKLERDFNGATEFMKSVAGNLGKDKLLYFYARFKQATQGKCNIPRPGMFDFQGKQKWDAWNGLKDMSKEEAMKEYIASMNEVDPEWIIKVKGQKSSLGLGVGVSTMVPDLEEELSDNQKSIYDWCKEGQVDQVQILLSTEGTVINQPDTEGLTLLHWACDRGYLDIVKLLLKCGANLNAADSDGQTPLHYACTCEHLSIVDILVKSGADVNAEDLEGCKPADNTLKKDIHKLITESVSDVN